MHRRTIRAMVLCVLQVVSVDQAAAQTVAIDKRDAVVWSQTQRITGKIDTSFSGEGSLWIEGSTIPVQAVARTDSFSVEVVLSGGTSRMVVSQDSAGTTISSDTVRLTLGYSLRPVMELVAEVDSLTVTLKARTIENPKDVPLVLTWSGDEANPAPAIWLSYDDSSATLAIPANAPEGEYYFTVRAAGGGDTVSARTFVTRDASGLRAFNLRTDHARWIDNAIVYQVTPYNFVANGGYRHITAKIPELRDLGITVLYLQPVYRTGFGGQGYDITDYFSLRTDLGTETELRTLIQTAHDHGLKVLFDFVPNHTSILHPYAQDAIQHGPLSHYYDFYQRTYDGAPYAMHYNTRVQGAMTFVYYFWNDLPNVNYDNPEVRRMMIEAGRYWVEHFDIDGYRIDAVWGVNARRPSFMQEWRLALKRIKPEIFLLGEDKATWPSSFEERFDAAYDWAPGESWVSQWVWQAYYSPSSNPTIFNFTPQDQRAAALRSSLTNNGTGYHPRAKILRFMENNDTFRFRATHDDARTRMAAALMFSLDGIPMLYNGQEIGAALHPYSTYEVFSQTSSIRSQDQFGLFDMYQQLARLRTRFPSLTGDNIEHLVSIPSASSFAYRRWAGEENIFVLVNMASFATTGRIYVPVASLGLDSTRQYYFTDLFTNETFPRTVAGMSQFEFPIGGFSTRMFILADSVVITSAPALADRTEIGTFDLSQNYPNPFNPRTAISFQLPEEGRVRLGVYDLLGREVADLLDEVRGAGFHTVAFDGSALSSGVYVYRLRFGDHAVGRRMVLVK